MGKYGIKMAAFPLCYLTEISRFCRYFSSCKVPASSWARFYGCSSSVLRSEQVSHKELANSGKQKRYANAISNLKTAYKMTQTPLVQIESVYKDLPKAQKYIPKAEVPVPRFVWKEQQWAEGFPSSPEEANVDILTYLEQKDCYKRLKKTKFKQFCVGSFVEVTYADKYAIGGKSRFRGICIYKSHWQNSLGASFTLRNVIENEALEINFQLYSPLIQELIVLKHQRFKEHQLKYLRDYPPAFSYVSEKMKEQPYTEEPELFEFNEEHKKKIDRWFSRLNQRKL